jgi:short-subunit dehydrogenase
MTELFGKRVLVTGVGIKPIKFVFKDITTGLPSHTSVAVDGIEYKANIGAATALECARAGATLHLVGRTENKLCVVKRWIESECPRAIVEYSTIDLNDKEALKNMLNSIQTDIPLYWVQSMGLGAGTVHLRDDNPYLMIDALSDELVKAELSVLTNTISLFQLLLPRFRNQHETRICVVSSMSAIRSIISGSMHNAAKGAISRFTNAAMIELNQDNIFITDIRPGIIDTGMYDSETVQDTMKKVGASYGYDYFRSGIFCAPPSAVGKAVVTALISEAHIPGCRQLQGLPGQRPPDWRTAIVSAGKKIALTWSTTSMFVRWFKD